MKFGDFVLYNNVLFTSAMSWLFAQTVKVILGIIRERQFDFKWFIGTGGMPSSHAAGVSALATSVGLEAGWGSPLFAVAVIFAFVVMFDAQTVRRAAGRQAQALNKMLDDIHSHKHIEEERLRELLGHTPIEVWAGLIIGILIALWLSAFAQKPPGLNLG